MKISKAMINSIATMIISPTAANTKTYQLSEIVFSHKLAVLQIPMSTKKSVFASNLVFLLWINNVS